MTSRSNNSNCENQSCNIPLSKYIFLNDNQTNSGLIQWINSFEFIRLKKNIARDFSDASKIYVYYVLMILN
jgi:hypothetical protein